MNHLDDLKTRVDRIIAELSDIIQRLERGIGNSKKAVPFAQVKEIETSITRMKRQGIPIPTELTELKIKLVSEHERYQECIALHQKLQKKIGELLNRATPRIPKRTRARHSIAASSTYRRPSNYERPLGSRGYSNLEDYLIPVIKLMWSGLDHKKAFRKIARKLDVRYNTVSSQCTRALDLTTDEFITQVNSKAIVDLLERKYPDKYRIIKTQLK